MYIALVKPPHVGSLVRGVGFYTQRLLSALNEIPKLKVQLVDFSYFPQSYRGFNLVHFPYFDFFHLTLPPWRNFATVVTIHDIIPLRFPQHFPLGVRGKTVWPIQKKLLQKVDLIITDSKSSKSDISKITAVPLPKVQVTYFAADEKFKPVKDFATLHKIKRKYNLPEKFVLYVGGVNWNKNLPTLVRACREANVSLVVVGQEALGENLDLEHAESQSYNEFINLITDRPKVLRLGFVPTEDLVVIYNLAGVYVQPSLYEGFGLPILEAMSCNCPVICGHNSSLPEVAGDAATFADVENFQDLAQKIAQVKRTGRELSQAAKFTWENTAHKTYEIYQKVLAGH